MKKILFTQRVEIIESYGERRDCADQKISEFIDACGFLPVPIMNKPLLVNSFCNEIKPDGILFTGGNDLFFYGGNAPERDETEKNLIRYAIEHNIPLFGICRGMQIIADFFGSKLEHVDGHVRTQHKITGLIAREMVNSYHGMAVKNVSKPLEVLSTTDDSVIEAVRHNKYSIAAIMWHPERVEGFNKEDINLISNFFNGGLIK